MKKIIIFSTHILKEKGKLFDENVIETVKTSVPYHVFEDAALKRSLKTMVINDMTDKKLSGFLNEKLAEELPNNPEAESFKRQKEMEGETTWNNFISKKIETVLQEMRENKKDESTMMSWISHWNLENELRAILPDVGSTNRAHPLKLTGQDVFAIKSLEENEQENCDRECDSKWIKALVDFAKDYSKGSQMELYLVLHDKDLSGYRGEDAYVCSHKVSKKLSGLDNCTVVFFAHTTNWFVDILTRPLCKRNICTEIEIAIKNYKDIETKKNESNEWINNMAKVKPDDVSKLMALNQELNERNKSLHQLLNTGVDTTPDNQQ